MSMDDTGMHIYTQGLMGGMYEVRRCDELWRHDTYTKFHEELGGGGRRDITGSLVFSHTYMYSLKIRKESLKLLS
jgi:hypothetical protein